MNNQPQKKTSDHLANERTFLAWIRTSIGIMGFGFVVVKFSLFVKQVSLILHNQQHTIQKGYSAAIGVTLVALGAMTALFAYLNYKKVEKEIDRDTYGSANPLIVFATFGLILVSALLIWYLIDSI
ncbi:YidH family protein [Sphingobacterium faecium]|uniref:YidH family protein n=1 Tax=Sphingobacterium faecium TaxID=34087 RepID=UPI00320AA0D2